MHKCWDEMRGIPPKNDSDVIACVLSLIHMNRNLLLKQNGVKREPFHTRQNISTLKTCFSVWATDKIITEYLYSSAKNTVSFWTHHSFIHEQMFTEFKIWTMGLSQHWGYSCKTDKYNPCPGRVYTFLANS
jgi:hypothetical protein